MSIFVLLRLLLVMGVRLRIGLMKVTAPVWRGVNQCTVTSNNNLFHLTPHKSLKALHLQEIKTFYLYLQV